MSSYPTKSIGGVEKTVHARIAESVLGKPLPPSAVVHHVDGTRRNNAHSNLVICQDQSYHFLLHQRTSALKATGNVNARCCKYCKQWDDPKTSNLVIYELKDLRCVSTSTVAMHKSCNVAHVRKTKQRRAS